MQFHGPGSVCGGSEKHLSINSLETARPLGVSWSESDGMQKRRFTHCPHEPVISGQAAKNRGQFANVVWIYRKPEPQFADLASDHRKARNNDRNASRHCLESGETEGLSRAARHHDDTRLF